MKLVEIKDVRVGQIWDNGNNFLIITGFSEHEPEMVHCRPVRRDEVTFYEDKK